jgi:hypothetical protein
VSTLRLRRDGVAWSDVGGEIVILDLRTSTYFSARDSAALLVAALAEGATTETLVDRVLETYDTTADVAHADVADFLAAMTDRNLLERVEA